jgi:hypothetical protein
MEESIIRDGNLKKFHKLIRKKGIDAILDEQTFQLILSSSLYSNYDMMGTWIQEVLKADLWHRLNPGTGTSLQAAPFRTLKVDQVKLTPKRMAKTIEAIIDDHQRRKTTAIRYWLPWFILYTEKVDPRFADKLDDTVFCLLFYEALDFAFRAKASAQTFRHMFHNDRLTLQVRARYLRYCTYCIENHLAKVGKIQFMGEVVCEIAPILLAYNLKLEKLAASIMSYMDAPYLAHIRQAFMEHIRGGMEDVPLYLFRGHPGFEEEEHSSDVPAYVFSSEEMPYLYGQKALLSWIEGHQPELILVEDILANHWDASKNLQGETLTRVLGENRDKVWAWCAANPLDEVDAVVDLAPFLPTPVPPALMNQVLFEVPFSDDLMAIAPPFHVHPEALGSYLFYLLDLCVRPDPPRLKHLLASTLSLPTVYLSDTRVETWRSLTRNIQDERNQPILSSYSHAFERAWARFFDREILKLLRKGVLTPEIWSILMTHGPPSLFGPRPSHTSNGFAWDYHLLHLRGHLPEEKRESFRARPFLAAFWQRVPPGTFTYPSSKKAYAKHGRGGWSPLTWIIAQTPRGCEEANEIWREAQRYSPSWLHGYGAGDASVYPLRLAYDKGSPSAKEWVKNCLKEIEYPR